MGKRKRGNEDFESEVDGVFLFGGEAKAEKAAKDLAGLLKKSRQVNDILRKQLSNQSKFVPEAVNNLDESLHEVEVLLTEAERILYQDFRKKAREFKNFTN